MPKVFVSDDIPLGMSSRAVQQVGEQEREKLHVAVFLGQVEGPGSQQRTQGSVVGGLQDGGQWALAPGFHPGQSPHLEGEGWTSHFLLPNRDGASPIVSRGTVASMCRRLLILLLSLRSSLQRGPVTEHEGGLQGLASGDQ